MVGWSLFTALGLPQGDVLNGVWQFVVEQIMVVGLSTMGAAITATLPQFAVVAVAAVMLMGTLIGQARPFIQQLPTLPLAGSATPLANWAVVTVVGAAAVLAYQYPRRHVVRAAVAATGVLVVGVLARHDRAPSVRCRASRADSGERAGSRRGRTGCRSPGGARRIGVDERCAGPPDALPVHGRYPAHVRRAAGHRASAMVDCLDLAPRGCSGDPMAAPEPRRLSAQRARETDDDGQPLESIARALGDVELLRPVRSEPSAFYTTLLSLPEAEVSRLASAQGPLDATVTLRAWRYRVVEAVPLAVGSAITARLGRLTVSAVVPTRDGVLVDARRVFLQRLTWTSQDLFGSGGVGSAERLAIRNTSRKQAVLLAAESGRLLNFSLVGGLSTQQLGTGAWRLHFVIPLADEDRARIGR